MVERNESSPPEAVISKLEELRAQHPVEDQAIRWQREHWATDKLDGLQVELDAIAEGCKADGDSLLIARRHVLEMADGDAIRQFLSSMVWGYGTAGYGPERVGEIVRHAGPGLRTKLENQRHAAQLGPQQAWTSFKFSDHLRGLGPAFASKFAYFAAYERSESPLKPLIVDLNTSWAMWKLIKLPRSVERQDTYVQYVEEAHRWADEIGCRADDVEWALFELGKNVERTISGEGGTDDED